MAKNTLNLIPIEHNPFATGEIERVIYPIEPQQEVWLSCVIGGDDANCAYNESISLQLTGSIDLKALDSALQNVIARHEALRYTFSADGKNIYVIQNSITELGYEDLSAYAKADRENYLIEFNRKDAERPFDLQQGPLFRATAFKLAGDHYVLQLTAHHIICDGWSFGIILEDLSVFYAAAIKGEQAVLPEAIAMSQYSQTMADYMAGGEYSTTTQYWSDKFTPLPPPLTLPTDRSRPSERTYQSRRDDFPIDQALVQAIKQLGAPHGLSFVNTLLVAFEVYLNRLTGQADIVVGLPTAGQAALGHFNLVGHCVNLLPIRSTIESNRPFIDHLKLRKSSLLDDYDHQRYTYGSLLKELKLKRDSSRIPLVPVVFNIDMGMDANVSFPDIKHKLISNPRAFENFELFLNATGTSESFVLEWSYNAHLFEATTINWMMEGFERLLRKIVATPHILIKDLGLPDKPDTGDDYPSAALSNEVAYPRNTPFFELISDAAKHAPNKTAIVFDGIELTYETLDSQSNRLAHYLLQHGITRGDVVGLAMERSADLIIALLAISKSGAAYLPLDPEYPADRIQFMLTDSTAKLLITQSKYAGTFNGGTKEVFIDLIEKQLPLLPHDVPQHTLDGNDLVYVLYTSGSTGKPKGVQIEHHNLTNFLLSMQRAPGLTADDTLLAVTTISFDIAALELYLPLISGATLLLADAASVKDSRRLLTLIDDHEVSVMQATPATWRLLVDSGWDKKKNLKALCGGELFPRELAAKLLDRCKAVWNMYGPTETTVWSTIKELKQGDTDLITVGTPIANTSVYILDEELNPLPANQVGQIFIAGDGVARGYHGRPDLTGERFVADVFDPTVKMYGTGDLGKVLENGELVCLGRIDHQVKIRGYRIELGEIEHQLARQAGIKEAVVTAREDTPGDQRLVAYFVPETVEETGGDVVSWKDKWDNIYQQGIISEEGLDISAQNLDVAIVEQLGNNAEDLKAQTADWLSNSLTRIRQLSPKHVFEIGSGAGQLLFELAAETESYLATDYAAAAIEKLKEKIDASSGAWGDVQAYVATADDFSCLDGVLPDLVLIHSVAQYFPDMDYLVQVIQQAANHMDSGCIFLGDIQGKNTLSIHHTMDQLYRTGEATTISAFKKIVDNRLRLEDELTMDPGFFYHLPRIVPQITGVDVQLRRGDFVNETTKYHYDVWLYVGENHATSVPSIAEKWQSLDRVGQLLSQQGHESIAIQAIPNKRTFQDIAAKRWLDTLPGDSTVKTLKEKIASLTGDGVDPNKFWELAEKYGYNAHTRWSSDGTDGTFEVVFIRNTTNRVLPPPPIAIESSSQIEDFIRNPRDIVFDVSKDQVTKWRENLRKSLPEYMLPNDWVALHKFPLTANNKIDRNALPKPDRPQHSSNENDLSLSENEKLVSNIWSQVLKVDQIGPDDDFFELGGHSLLTVELMTRLEKTCGKSLPLTSIFRHPTLKGFAALLGDGDSGHVENKQIEKTTILDSIPIVESQKEIWLSCLIGGDEANLAYNQSFSIKLEGHFSMDAFQKAADYIVARHEALRAAVSEDGEHIIISAKQTVPIAFEDLSSLRDDEKERQFNSYVQQVVATPLDLHKGPLFKIFIHKFDDSRHYFSLVIHHIVCDGTSMEVLINEISTCYNSFLKGAPPMMPPCSQLSDYAASHVKFVNSEEHKAIQDFWFSQYADSVPVLNLPTDFAHPVVRTYKGDYLSFEVGGDLYPKLKSVSASAGMSVAATLTTLVEVFLYHRSRQNDITLGITSAGQYVTGHADMVGHSVNLLPLRSKINPDQSFVDYLATRKDYIYDAYDHQRLTFSELLRKLNLKRDRGHVPLVPFVLTIQMANGEHVNFEGLDSQIISNPRASHTFEVLLNVTVDSETQSLTCYWAYNTQLFKDETISRMMEELSLLMKTVFENPTITIKDSLPVSNPFPEFINHSVPYPEDKTIVDFIEEQATKTPHGHAVIFAGEKLTYEELNAKANRLANHLMAHASEERLIPIYIRPSMEMVVGILGILKSGKGYVPIDPETPKQRVSYIISETKSTILISDRHLAVAKLPDQTQLRVCCLDDPDEICWASDTNYEQARIDPADVAYVIYTSGSTGNPKGVMISHRSLVDYFAGLGQHLPAINDCLSFALASSYATDLGNTVLFGALINGGALHVFDKEKFNDATYIKDYFINHQIDCLKIVPSHWRYLSEASNGLYPKKLLIFGGELLPTSLVEQINESGNDCQIVNHYGPTETTIGKLMHIVDHRQEYGKSIPIGRPFSNTSIYVLNNDLHFCPVGVPGNLYIGGDGLAMGYHNNDPLTKASFIPNPFPNHMYTTLYKTGDVVRWHPNGNIEYLERDDEQVKIRGNRVELPEIQRAILALGAITDCVVVAADFNDSEKQLVAYVISEGTFSRDRAIEELKPVLPNYMIPRVWIEIDDIPRTSNGKVNKKALPPADGHLHAEGRTSIAPRNATEVVLADIWKKALGVKEVGIDDDFFELGGHSLMAVKLMTTIEKKFGQRLPLATLFEYTTVEQIAKLLDGEQTEVKWDCLVPIKPNGTKPPMYIVHGAGLNVLLFNALKDYLDEDQPIYGLQARGLNGVDEPFRSIEQMASHYISEILTQNPVGPYFLSGYSLGGVIAYEMAKQLIAAGKDVKMLAMLDTFADPPHESSSRIAKRFRMAKKLLMNILYSLYMLAKDPKGTFQYKWKNVRRLVRQKYWKLAGKADKVVGVFGYLNKIDKINTAARKQYVMKPINAEIDVFRATTQRFYANDMQYLGWREYAKKGVHVHNIPGDHNKIFKPPYNKDLSRTLQRVMDHKLANQTRQEDHMLSSIKGV